MGRIYAGRLYVVMMGVISFSNISVTVEEGEKSTYQVQEGDKKPTWLSNVHLYMFLKHTSFTILSTQRMPWKMEPGKKKERGDKLMQINKLIVCICDGAL